MSAVIPRTNAERWLTWAALSVVLLLWVYPAWATDYYMWKSAYDYSNGRWEFRTTVVSRAFILDRSPVGFTHEHSPDDPIVRQASWADWELRTRLDFGTNFVQALTVLVIAGGAILTMRFNRRAPNSNGSSITVP